MLGTVTRNTNVAVVRAITQLGAPRRKLTSKAGVPTLEGNSESPPGVIKTQTMRCPDPRASDSSGLGRPGNLHF